MSTRNTTFFTHFARATARAAGRPLTFTLAVSLLAIWAALGPFTDFSDSWQLAVNTGTTIITFLMVFLIQNTQHRDSEAVQLKLAEIIRAIEGAHDSLVDLDAVSDEELERLREKYASLAERARDLRRRGKADTAVVDTD